MSMRIATAILAFALAARGEQDATCSAGSTCPATSPEDIPEEGSVLLQGFGARKKATAAAEDHAAEDRTDAAAEDLAEPPQNDHLLREGLKNLASKAGSLAEELEANSHSDPEAKQKIALLGEKIRALHGKQSDILRDESDPAKAKASFLEMASHARDLAREAEELRAALGQDLDASGHAIEEKEQEGGEEHQEKEDKEHEAEEEEEHEEEHDEEEEEEEHGAEEEEERSEEDDVAEDEEGSDEEDGDREEEDGEEEVEDGEEDEEEDEEDGQDDEDDQEDGEEDDQEEQEK